MGVPARSTELSVGDQLPELPILFDLEFIQAYENVVPHYDNIHNNYEVAAQAGFNQPFASGTMLIAVATERFLPEYFGGDWPEGGSLGYTFLRPIAPGDKVVFSGEVVAKLPHGDKTKVVLSLGATIEDGPKVAVGSASAIVS